ncbi:hypothetical protein WN51_08142 [Melipona quadrifasciata]|uniref:Uncharacterized protein n=1 Tax=Melipona quadrifasciata TaxID=166423 RepID=A0A0M8ZRK2_9HYME|nr:hypothetical protein WN51_08142 [Melipona quadrifasciata]
MVIERLTSELFSLAVFTIETKDWAHRTIFTSTFVHPRDNPRGTEMIYTPSSVPERKKS